jgi:hypothetical protein
MNDELLLPRRRGMPMTFGAGIAAATIIVLALAIWRAASSPARYNRTSFSFGEEELLAQCNWLKDVMKHWRQQAVAGVALPKFSEVGAFPVGNGRVFAIIGLHWPFVTMSNIIGPSYQKKVGFFGNLVPWLVAQGKPLSLPEQSVAWVRSAPIVCVTSRSPDGMELQVFYAALPDLPAIVFVAKVANRGKDVRRGVALALASNLSTIGTDEHGLIAERGNIRMTAGIIGGRGRLSSALCPPRPSNLEKRMDPFGIGEARGVVYPLGLLGPGKTVVKIGYVSFTTSEEEKQEIVQALEKLKLGVLEQCRARWQEWEKSVAALESSDRRLDEFLTAQKYIVACQQARSGGFSPMDGYTYLWVRDSNGPIRFFSKIGGAEKVKAHLEYHFRVCATSGVVGNNMGLDQVVPDSIKQPDWTRVQVDRAEVPSFVILQHYWYYRATGDLALIRWHWGMLRRCLLGQEVDSRGLLPFHGDETYRFPGYELFSAGHDIEDWVCLETRSADSAFEYVAAARAMAEMAAAQGIAAETAEYQALASRVAAATERLYWQPERGFYAPSRSDFADQVHRPPFANINLRPLWVGYASAENTRQQQNVLNSLKYLWKSNGLVKMTPSCGYYVGMTPGYVVWNLAELRHPAVRAALDGLLDSAETSGGFAEMVTPEDKPADMVWGMHRARPWEGGINAEAMVHALSGYCPDSAARRVYLRPLPLAGGYFRLNHLPLGASAINLEVKDEKGRRHYTIELDGLPETCLVDLAVVVWGKGARVTKLDARNALAVQTITGPAWPWAEEIVLRGIELAPDDPIHVSVQYTPRDVAALGPALPFEFGPANVPAGTKAILVTPSAAKVEAERRRLGGSVYAIDTKLPWPLSYLRSALLQGEKPRVARLILDVDRYPGAFKRANFWTVGAGAGLLHLYKKAGGMVEKVAQPSPPPKAYGTLTVHEG